MLVHIKNDDEHNEMWVTIKLGFKENFDQWQETMVSVNETR
jgi:hypothetical protein